MKESEGNSNALRTALNGRPRAQGGRGGIGEGGGVVSLRVSRSDKSGPEDKWRVRKEIN